MPSSTPPARVRVRSHPPLRKFQAWLPIDPKQSIGQFKASILSFIHNSDQSQPSSSSVPINNDSSNIDLLVDGFSFLDQSLCNLIDTNRDLIDVKILKSTTSTTAASTSKKRPRAQGKSTCSENSPAVNKSSAELPTLRLIKPIPKTSQNQKSIQLDPVTTIKPRAPPGQGTTATKARNKRKRMKKLLARNGAQFIPTKNPVQNEKSTIDLSSRLSKPTEPPREPPLSSTPARNTLTRIRESAPAKKHDLPQSSESSQDSSSSSSSSSSSASSSISEDSDTSSSSSQSSAGPTACTAKPPPKSLKILPASLTVVQRSVPTLHDPQLNMMSLSNKNKRKNLKRGQPVKSGFQTNKIVFESHVPAIQPTSPVHRPLSPSRSSSSLAPSINYSRTLNLSTLTGLTLEQSCRSEVPFDQELDTSTLLHTHGPPPSSRDPDLIPSNIVITSVDVLDPNWTAGDIGHWTNSGPSHFPLTTTSKKKRNRNRKKQMKRQRRLENSKQKSNQLENNQENESESEDSVGFISDDSDLEGIDEDIEVAYSEFINSGGHSKSKQQADEESELNRISNQWEQLEKLDRERLEVGSNLAIKVMELSLETFTPESLIYFGTLIESNKTHIKIRVNQECLPKTNVIKQDSQDDNPNDEEMDTGLLKESLRDQQRVAILESLWGDHNLDDGVCTIREWELISILEIRKI